MMIKLMEGRWINSNHIEMIIDPPTAEDNGTRIFMSVIIQGEQPYYSTAESANDLARRINSGEEMWPVRSEDIQARP